MSDRDYDLLLELAAKHAVGLDIQRTEPGENYVAYTGVYAFNTGLLPAQTLLKHVAGTKPITILAFIKEAYALRLDVQITIPAFIKEAYALGLDVQADLTGQYVIYLNAI